MCDFCAYEWRNNIIIKVTHQSKSIKSTHYFNFIIYHNLITLLYIQLFDNIPSTNSSPKYDKYIPYQLQSINQLNNQTIKQSNNQTIKQSNNQTNKQSINQSNKQTNDEVLQFIHFPFIVSLGSSIATTDNNGFHDIAPFS